MQVKGLLGVMLNIECRGCKHDQSFVRSVQTVEDSKVVGYRFECTVAGCDCTMDGAPDQNDIATRPQPKPDGPIVVASLTDEQKRRLEQQFADKAKDEPGKYKTTSPEELFNQPVPGRPWVD